MPETERLDGLTDAFEVLCACVSDELQGHVDLLDWRDAVRGDRDRIQLGEHRPSGSFRWVDGDEEAKIGLWCASRTHGAPLRYRGLL